MSRSQMKVLVLVEQSNENSSNMMMTKDGTNLCSCIRLSRAWSQAYTHRWNCLVY